MKHDRHDQARRDELRALAAQGLSSGVIAEKMGLRRSQVIGLGRRMGVKFQAGTMICRGKVCRADNWTEAEIQQLKDYHAAGKFALEAATLIGRAYYGLLSKARDLGMKFRKPKVVRPKKERQRHKYTLRPATGAEKRSALERFGAIEHRFDEGYMGQTGRLTILELRPNTCRFPIDNKFCGLHTHRKTSWCAHHYDRVRDKRFVEAAE